jgi:hypothetical protein
LKVFLELLQQKNLVIAPVEFDDKTPIDKTDIDPPGSAEAPIWKHRYQVKERDRCERHFRT